MSEPMTHDPGLTEQLSAYLDGELDDVERRHIEDRLAAESDARTQLRRLEEACDLLDDLPRAPANDAFTRSTVEMVAVRSASLETPAGASWAIRGGWLLAAVGLLLSGVLGFAWVRRSWSDSNEQLLTALPVLENLEAWLRVRDVDFLKSLHASGLFPPRQDEPRLDAILRSSDEARVYLESLPPAEKQDLFDVWQRFQALPAEEQRLVREMHEGIAADPQRAELLAVLSRYQEWAGSLTAAERASLLKLEQKERLAEIRRLRLEQDRKLDEPDQQALFSWMRERMQKHGSSAPAEDRHRVDGRRKQGRRNPPPPTADECQDLRRRLSQKAGQQMDAQASQKQKQELIGSWLRQAYSGRGRPNQNAASFEELAEFMRTLPEAEKERLLGMPTEEMRQELRRLYNWRQRSRGRGGDGRNDPRG